MALSVDIRKRLGSFSLQVAFEAGEETMALLGASGAGKSMTLKCIAGIETPDEGRILLDGRTLFDSERKINLPPQQRRVGYLFQQYALFPNMTVAQNIAVGIRDRAKKQAVTAEKICQMRLEGLEHKRPAQLSGGQQQRVALARVLASTPEVLLLDEPFAALDSYLRWQLELELFDALAAFGRTALLVSHSRDEVCRLSDSVCVLCRGASEPKEPVREFFRTPATLSACLLSGCKNFSRIRPLDGSRVEALDWDAVLPVSADIPPDAGWLGVRAHHIALSAEAKEHSIPCRVERVIEDLFSVIVMLGTPGGSKGYARIRAELGKADWASLCGRETLHLCIEPRHIMFLRE